MVFRAVFPNQCSPKNRGKRIHKNFDIPRKIPDVPRSILDFFFGQFTVLDGVIPVRYELTQSDSLYSIGGSSGCEK